MFALELGGKKYQWIQLVISLFGSFALFFIAFFLFELKAKDPILPFWLFRRRLFATSQILTLFVWGNIYHFNCFIPIFVQAVYGGSATNAG